MYPSTNITLEDGRELVPEFILLFNYSHHHHNDDQPCKYQTQLFSSKICCMKLLTDVNSYQLFVWLLVFGIPSSMLLWILKQIAWRKDLQVRRNQGPLDFWKFSSWKPYSDTHALFERSLYSSAFWMQSRTFSFYALQKWIKFNSFHNIEESQKSLLNLTSDTIT